MKIISHAVRFAACLSFPLLLTVGCGANEPKIKAPDFAVEGLNGKQITLEQFKGKVVFIEFWATWCGPCIVSIPEVEKLMREYKDKNVEVVSISLDTGEEEVRRFPFLNKMSEHTAMAGTSGVELKYRVEGIPAFYLIDQNGYVAGAWQGFHPAMSKIWRKELDRLLKG